MIKGYLKIVFKNILRYKNLSIISITSLAVGIVSSVLMFLFVKKELSYYSFYKNADDVSLVHKQRHTTDGLKMLDDMWISLFPNLESDLPVVESGELKAQIGAVESSSGLIVVSTKQARTSQNQGPHLARWARAQIHGGAFLQTVGVIDLARPMPDSFGFVVLIQGSLNEFVILQAVAGAERAPLIYRNGEWSTVSKEDLIWIGEVRDPLSQKLGTSASRLSVLGESIAMKNDTEKQGRWSGSTKSGFPALSMDSGLRIVQASWLQAKCQYGVYGVVRGTAGDDLHTPTDVDDYRHFVGFMWDPATKKLDVVTPDSYTISGKVHPPQEGDELRATLVAGVVELMSHVDGFQ